MVTSAIEGAIGALEHLVAQLAANEGLRGQNARLVLHRSCRFSGSSTSDSCIVMMERCTAAALVGSGHGTEAGHGCVHLELIRLGAAELGRLLALEELFSLSAIVLFSLSVD